MVYSLVVSKGKLKIMMVFLQYNGISSYYVVMGMLSKNVLVYVLINVNKYYKMIVIKQFVGILCMKVLKKVWFKCNFSKVIKVMFGKYDGMVVWEIMYLNQKKNLCYEILQYFNGNQLKLIINI